MMPGQDHYQMCRNGIGRAVEIHTKDGDRFHGIIEKVDEEKVYLSPIPDHPTGGSNRYGSTFAFGPFFPPFIFTPFVPFANIFFLRFFPFII